MWNLIFRPPNIFCFCPGCRLDIVFVVDSSGSITFSEGGAQNWQDILSFIISLSNALFSAGCDLRVGVVVFSTDVTVSMTLAQGTNPDSVESIVSAIPHKGDKTNIALGLETALDSVFVGTNGDRADAQDFIILIVDGTADLRPNDQITVATRAKDDDIYIITVGITGSINVNDLNTIASNNQVFQAATYSIPSAQQNAIQQLIFENAGFSGSSTGITFYMISSS